MFTGRRCLQKLRAGVVSTETVGGAWCRAIIGDWTTFARVCSAHHYSPSIRVLAFILGRPAKLLRSTSDQYCSDCISVGWIPVRRQPDYFCYMVYGSCEMKLMYVLVRKKCVNMKSNFFTRYFLFNCWQYFITTETYCRDIRNISSYLVPMPFLNQ